jgi:hypothetical protein
LENLVDLFLEVHVQQSVGFVQHQVAKGTQVEATGVLHEGTQQTQHKGVTKTRQNQTEVSMMKNDTEARLTNARVQAIPLYDPCAPAVSR